MVMDQIWSKEWMYLVRSAHHAKTLTNSFHYQPVMAVCLREVGDASGLQYQDAARLQMPLEEIVKTSRENVSGEFACLARGIVRLGKVCHNKVVLLLRVVPEVRFGFLHDYRDSGIVKCS